MFKHTPTPWSLYYALNVQTKSGDHICSCGVNGRNHEINSANAQFIVTACNSHDELLEALEGLRLEFYANQLDGICAVKKAEEALRKVGAL